MASLERSCKSCHEKEETMRSQKETVAHLGRRLKSLVQAYKGLQEANHDLAQKLSFKETLLGASVESSPRAEQQQRLSALEASVAELSALCGQYQQDRLQDQQLIEKLTLQLKECQTSTTTSLDVPAVGLKDLLPNIEQVRTTRQRATQTELVGSDTRESEPKKLSLEREMKSTVVNEVATQTEPDSLSTSLGVRRTELAIVLPTARERQNEFRNEPNSPFEGDSGETPLEPSAGITSRAYENETTLSRTPSVSEPPPTPTTATGVSLFYINELARKEIEVAEARLQAREYECALRELQWKHNMDKYRLQSKVTDLEKQQQVMQRDVNFQPNMTYVRNVLIRFINTKDKHQKQFMINALLTALDVDANEAKATTSHHELK